MLKEKALATIKSTITEIGILASAQNKDNYARVWSRDSMMTGFVGILYNDQEIVEGLEKSIKILAKHQSETGAIPSNVSSEKVSYGSLVGRVDATTWWIITTCEYLKKYPNATLKTELLPKIEKALFCLKTWEYNNRGLIYTPLGGNWADEYITSGYTLYDNVLRYWTIKNAADLFQNQQWIDEAKKSKKLIENNFYKTENTENIYHENAYKQANEKPYFFASLNANGYDERFDMAGNALAIYLDFKIDLQLFNQFLKNLNQEFTHWMLPVFYPIIFPKDDDWRLLENNYSYEFKNQPYHFHNGGSWPIMLGWLCAALKKRNTPEIAEKILAEYEFLLNKNGLNFQEYYSTDQLKPNGTNDLCFSATGYLLMTFNEKTTL